MRWTVLLVVGLLGFGIWWETYRFHDCRSVGHSRLYCIAEIGE